MPEPEIDVRTQMREDWNRRAREDAYYYVAFGRRDQDDQEFLNTGLDVVKGLEWDVRRLLPHSPRGRALEIGCGPGRLMLPLSRYFSEIHGIDVSEEMIRIARERLQDVPNAFVQVSSGAGLEGFDDSSFEFIYSYAVFQHIPSRDVVLNYLREARRVLKPGGFLRCQINGLTHGQGETNTWGGIAFSAAEIRDFMRAEKWQLLALEGAGTQYMWVTCRQPTPVTSSPSASTRIRRVTNAASSEPVAPPHGRFASISIWIEGLPDDADLFSLDVLIAGLRGELTYLGPKEHDGLQQLNVMLPGGLGTGLQPIDILLCNEPLEVTASIRIIPPPPVVPRILWFTDGIDLLSKRIVSRSVKLIADEIMDPTQVSVSIDSRPADCELFCIDPRIPRYEVNVKVPDECAPGDHQIVLQAGRRRLAPISIDVV